MPLFTFHTIEDFWLGYQRVPKLEDVFEDGRHGARNIVERVEPDGSLVTTGCQGYMLFRESVQPEYKQEVDGRRVTLNAYRSRVAASNIDLTIINKAWETMLLAAIGELCDPAECLNGVYLTDQHSGRSTALRLELWFAVRDDRIADAICEEFREILNKTDGVFFPKFSKLEYFVTKHKVCLRAPSRAVTRARAHPLTPAHH